MSVGQFLRQLGPPLHGVVRASSRQLLDTIPCVKLAAAALHVSIAAVLGEDHHVHPVHDRYQDPLWVQDLPLPWCFYARPYRCRTCNNRGSLERRVPLSMLSSLPPEARQEYFPVTTEDIFTSLPEVLIFSEAHKGKTYLTARFFYEISQRLYECFNSREVRRHVAALYSANALAEATTMESRGFAPYSLVWLEAALVVSLIEQWRDRWSCDWVSSTYDRSLCAAVIRG